MIDEYDEPLPTLFALAGVVLFILGLVGVWVDWTWLKVGGVGFAITAWCGAVIIALMDSASRIE